MSRLIDADALQQHFADMQKYERCACNFVDEGGWPATEWYCVEDALENAPTIDAIPVEWLREQCKVFDSMARGGHHSAWIIKALTRTIPADIAEKLGLKPKEG